MTVKELVGGMCNDIVVCPQLCEDMEVSHAAQSAADAGAAAAAAVTAGAPPSELRLEASV